MGLLDRFLNAIKLNDDFDDDDDEDFLDEEEDFDDDYDDEDYTEKKHSRGGLFNRFRSYDDDEDDDDEEALLPEEDDEDDSVRPARASRTARKARGSGREKTARSGSSAKERKPEKKKETARESRIRNRSKVTSIRKKNTDGNGNGVNVIRPASMEDTPEIADYLMNNSTVVLNLEGLDIEIAQRVIDFTCGVCYSLDGSLQKVSSYIFILTPRDVDISGDFQSILSGAFDIPAMKSTY